MHEDQVKILLALARRKKKEKRTNLEVLSFLQSAKILAKDNNFTKHYSNIKKALAARDV